MSINERIHQNIKCIMKAKKLKTKDLSELTGDKPSTLTTRFSRLKIGCGISTTSLEKLAKALKVDPSDLIS